jgi:hypothetical protein
MNSAGPPDQRSRRWRGGSLDVFLGAAAAAHRLTSADLGGAGSKISGLGAAYRVGPLR